MSIDPVSALPRRPSPGAAGAHLGELYAGHSRMVYGICLMLLRNADEAEDATQQVFLAAYSNLLTGTEVRDPAAWLGTIARNACRRRAAARMREPLAVADELTLASPAADEAAIGREEAAALYAQLAGLPDKQREAVVLRDLYGLRYDEVAKALGTSRPAVEGLLFRGRRQLQRRLRPGAAAGVLAVPFAIQESIAYAVPGFASTAAPAGAAAAAAAGIPLLAKLATAGAAVAVAGSAGVAAERSLDDPPARLAQPKVQQVKPITADVAAEPSLPVLLPVPPGGFPIVRSADDDDSSGPGRGDDEPARAAGAADDHEQDGAEEPDEDAEENRGKGNADEDDVKAEREDNSGPGGGGERRNEDDAERELEDEDHSGPGDDSRADSSGTGRDDDGEREIDDEID